MIKKVRKIDNPIIIWFGGVCWVPIACRRNEKTTASRVKDVIISKIAGASEKTVSKSSIWSNTETFCGLSASSNPNLSVGTETAWAVFSIRRRARRITITNAMSCPERLMMT
jgi:hypothetical protein